MLVYLLLLLLLLVLVLALFLLLSLQLVNRMLLHLMLVCTLFPSIQLTGCRRLCTVLLEVGCLLLLFHRAADRLQQMQLQQQQLLHLTLLVQLQQQLGSFLVRAIPWLLLL